MSNTINVNGMTSYYSSFIKSVTSQTLVDKGSKVNSGTVTGEKDSFISTLSSKVETADAVEGTITVSTKDMTMEEYKQYISEKISSFPFHPTKAAESYSINISDAGFEVMKNDPEYEKWVLDDLKTCFAMPVPSWYQAMGGPSTYTIFNYGATKEEFSGQRFPVGVHGNKERFESSAENNFWTRRSEQKKFQERANKKAAEKKELEEKWLQEAVEKRQAYTDFLNGKTSFKTNSISELNDFFQIPSDPKVAGILSAYEAGTFAGGGLI